MSEVDRILTPEAEAFLAAAPPDDAALPPVVDLELDSNCTERPTATEAKAEVDQAVEEAKASPIPFDKDLWTDIYYKGTEPPSMRGREREEIHYY